jgi:putative transposase
MASKTIRLKVKPDAYGWLNQAAIEANQVWNWCAERSLSVFRNTGRWMSGYDLARDCAGTSKCFSRIGSQTIAAICAHYALKRRASWRAKLRWRKSFGAKRSLGWVAYKGRDVQREGNSLTFIGKRFRVFNAEYLGDQRIRGGSFAQDACRDWWLCVTVDVVIDENVAPQEAVGVDLGLKDAAVTSNGERLESGVYRCFEPRIAQAQRRGHKRQAKRIHRKAARCRADAIHKFSTGLVRKYQSIVIGDVSPTQLVKTRMAKSVLDAGWGMLKTQLHYKGEHAGRSVQVVDESYTTRACSSCGCLSGPSGLRQLVVRAWTCEDCGASHDRDINAATNILARAKALASICGNKVQP